MNDSISNNINYDKINNDNNNNNNRETFLLNAAASQQKRKQRQESKVLSTALHPCLVQQYISIKNLKFFLCHH